MVENRCVHGGELLERSHSPEAEHHTFSPSIWKVRVLGSVVESAAGFLPISCPDRPQRCTVGPKSICDDDLGLPVLSHCFLEEFQCGFLVTRLGDKASQHLSFVIDGSPKVMPLTVDLHENLVEMPLPAARSQPLNAAPPDLGCEHRVEPMPPVAHRFMADIDAAFVQQILHVSERKC